MRRAFPLLLLVLLPACRHPTARPWDAADWDRYVARLEAARTAQGTAFPPDSLARLGATLRFPGPFGEARRDTARAHALLRLAMAQGSREAPLYLAWATRDSLHRRRLLRLALHRGEGRAVGWLAIPFVRDVHPLRADSLVLLARAARRHGAREGARSVEQHLAGLDRMANLGHPQADSLRRDLVARGLWSETFAAR